VTRRTVDLLPAAHQLDRTISSLEPMVSCMENAMARKKTAVKLREVSPEVARARVKRLAEFLAEQAGMQPLVLDELADELRWAARCFHARLSGEAKSLDHAFGLVPPAGNPRKVRVWPARAADADSKGLSTMAVADRFGINERNVRRGRQRGRIENERAETEKIVSRISDRLDKAQQVERAGRVAKVKRFSRKHHIKPGK
jgi:hypothetical protein